MLTTVKDLPSLLNYVTVEESANATTGVHEPSSIRGIGKPRQVRPSPRTKSKICGNCGQPLHGENNRDRTTKAFNKECAGNSTTSLANADPPKLLQQPVLKTLTGHRTQLPRGA